MVYLIILTITDVSGLWMIESVDSIKLASQLNKQWELEDREEKLNIMLQINTSAEEGINDLAWPDPSLRRGVISCSISPRAPIGSDTVHNADTS